LSRLPIGLKPGLLIEFGHLVLDLNVKIINKQISYPKCMSWAGQRAISSTGMSVMSFCFVVQYYWSHSWKEEIQFENNR